MLRRAVAVAALAAMVGGGLALPPAPAAARPFAAGNAGYFRPIQGRGGGRHREDRRWEGRRGYDGRGYEGRDYGRRYRGRCRDRGTGGMIIGAIAGGLLGDAAVGRRGDGTAGAIVGAGVGALAGRAIDRDC